MSTAADASPAPSTTADARTVRRGRMVPAWAGPGPVLAAWTVAVLGTGFALGPEAGRPALACLLFGMMPAWVVVSSGVHELGHVVAGLATGYRFLGLVVGPLSVSRAGDRLVGRGA